MALAFWLAIGDRITSMPSVLYGMVQPLGEDRIPVMQQILVDGAVRDHLPQLL
jgi:hypothetical protein